MHTCGETIDVVSLLLHIQTVYSFLLSINVLLLVIGILALLLVWCAVQHLLPYVSGTIFFPCWINTPLWIVVWNNICGIASFNILHPWRWYGLFRFCFLHPRRLCFHPRRWCSLLFYWFIYYYFGGDKISAHLYNTSIWVSTTLWNGVGDIFFITCFNSLAACRIVFYWYWWHWNITWIEFYCIWYPFTPCFGWIYFEASIILRSWFDVTVINFMWWPS